jgi:multidrug efflux pump subunit AcrA (membrane-fusion protein)
VHHVLRRAGGEASRLTGVVLVLVLTLGACSDGGDPGVRVAAAGRATVTEVVEAPATVTARAVATVSAATDGLVAEMRVREGQLVRAGQVVLRLESPQARKNLRQALVADRQAASAGSAPVPAPGLSGRQRQADLTARRAFARARRSAQAITDPQVRRQALSAVAASRAQYDAARAQADDAVRAFQAGLGSLSGAVAALSSAQRVQTRAALAAARRTVEGLVVRAPISGTVSFTASPTSGGQSASGLLDQLPQQLQGQAGALLGSGGTSAQVSGTLAEGQPVRSGQPLVTVTDSSTLSLTAQVDETDVLLVRPGVEARVELDAVPDATYAATVVAVDPTPAASSRGGVTYVVRLSLDAGRDADGAVAPTPRAGMSAVARLRVRTARDVVAAPVSAVFRDGRRDAVWVVVNGRARKRTVRLGAQGQSRLQVLEGLRVGERLVVRGADRVHAGQQVQ